MPILGIVSSGIIEQGAGFELIASTYGTGSSSSITFTDIPATYNYLQLRVAAQASNGGFSTNSLEVRLNSDTGNNYSKHALLYNGSAVAVGATTTDGMRSLITIGGSGLTAGTLGVGIVDIIDYADTSKYTTIKTQYGCDTNGGGGIGLSSGQWRNTNAVTSLTIFETNNNNLSTVSSFHLYGIKG